MLMINDLCVCSICHQRKLNLGILCNGDTLSKVYDARSYVALADPGGAVGGAP